MTNVAQHADRDLDGPTPTLHDLDAYRTELTGYCYRMLGSAVDAEDAVQETITRAWRALDRFEGRSSLRTWLYRIASNVCFDHLRAAKRRKWTLGTGPRWTPGGDIPGPVDGPWIEPAPDARVLSDSGDPADLAEARESVRLALVAALQHLPARQRAALVLCDVLRWPATDAAELLDTTVASVNSALQRVRATLAERGLSPVDVAPQELHPDDRALLDRYVDAFERYDIDALAELVHADATQTMPPYELWMRGREHIAAWMTGPGAECAGSRLLPLRANGRPAFAQYRARPDGQGHDPWALQVLEVADGSIVGFSFFLDTARLFPLFGAPLHLPPRPAGT